MDPARDESPDPQALLPPSRAAHITGVVLLAIGGFLAVPGGFLLLFSPKEGGVGAVAIVMEFAMLAIGAFLALLGGSLWYGAKQRFPASPVSSADTTDPDH